MAEWTIQKEQQHIFFFEDGVFAFSYCGDNEQALDILRRLRATEELGAEDAINAALGYGMFIQDRGDPERKYLEVEKNLYAYARALEVGDI